MIVLFASFDCCSPGRHEGQSFSYSSAQFFPYIIRFPSEHGNIQVPSDRTGPYASLVRWVLFVRRQIALYNEDPKKAPSLNDTKLFRLEELGFDISGGSDRPQPTWDEMFEKLQRYKEEHGTITIPKKKSTDLRNWIARQRYQYDKLRQGKSSLMTKDQMDKLTSIGFSFTSTYTKCSFDERAAQWLEYTSKHGQDVSTSWRAKMPDGRNSLGSWVKKTRQKYAQLQKGQPANLTQEQIDRLTSELPILLWSSHLFVLSSYEVPSDNHFHFVNRMGFRLEI